MAARELVVLGTASQAPTRYRNHNGYLLRWDGEGILFDPGEGTQRQLILAGVRPSAITRICITHFHGDHCLGLPGVLGRLALDGVTRPVDVYFPASGAPYFERLCHASVADLRPCVRPHPVTGGGLVDPGPPFRLIAAPLEHRTDTVGWRVEEPDGVRLLPDHLAAAGISGPDVGRLLRKGRVGDVTVADVSAPRRGQTVAFVMDTRWCDAAVALARDADLVVCEATFLEAERELADGYGHLTAAQAARLAVQAGAGHLVLSHFSQRHPDEQDYVDEAVPVFPRTTQAHDLDVIPLPPRRSDAGPVR